MGTYKYGWTPSKKDSRDIHYSLVLERKALPERIDLRNFCPSVKDQGQIGSCVWNAYTSYLEYLAIKDNQPQIPFSRLFGYYNTRKIEGTLKEDAGCEIRDAIKVGAKLGVCPEITWPYDEDNLYDTPPEEAYKEALDYQILKYYKVTGLYEIQNAIAAGYPVIFGMRVYESFESDEVKQTGIVPVPRANEKEMGGHCTLLVGYDSSERMAIDMNSWGPNWGMHGFCKIPFEILESHLIDDCWVITKGEQI
jgi:C1A family cysteine protease